MRSSNQLNSLLVKMQSISFLINTRAKTYGNDTRGHHQHHHHHSPADGKISRFTYHHGKDDGSSGGLDEPEQNQTAELDDGEEVHLPQRYMSEIDEVWLVLGWHAEKRDAVKELEKINQQNM